MAKEYTDELVRKSIKEIKDEIPESLDARKVQNLADTPSTKER